MRDNGVNPVFQAPGKNFLTGFVRSDGSVLSLEGFGRREDVQGRLKQYSKDGEELVILPGGLAVKERLGFAMKKVSEGDLPRYDLFLKVDTQTQSDLGQDDLRVTVAGQPVAISVHSDPFTIRADMSFKRVGTEEVLWEQSQYVYRGDFELTLDEQQGTVIDPEDPSIQLVSREFAQTLVIDMLEGF